LGLSKNQEQRNAAGDCFHEESNTIDWLERLLVIVHTQPEAKSAFTCESFYRTVISDKLYLRVQRERYCFRGSCLVIQAYFHIIASCTVLLHMTIDNYSLTKRMTV
jgi:hypothetical protein